MTEPFEFDEDEPLLMKADESEEAEHKLTIDGELEIARYSGDFETVLKADSDSSSPSELTSGTYGIEIPTQRPQSNPSHENTGIVVEVDSESDGVFISGYFDAHNTPAFAAAAEREVDSRESNIHIDTDAPAQVDELGRAHLVETLASVIRSSGTPLVIAIYGGWGTGKTSILRQLQQELANPLHAEDSDSVGPIRTVWFDPWMHQFDDLPALGMLHAAVDQLGLRSRRDILTSLSKIAFAMTEDLQLPLIGLKVGKLVRVRQEIAADDLNRREERARLQEHFESIIRATGADEQNRVVFFIDDLDRCQPRTALSLLEALKLHLDLPGCIYVLAIDRRPLEAAVEAEYANAAVVSEHYLDKIVQLPVSLPAVDRRAMERFISKRLPTGLNSCAPMLLAASGDNPRSIKRTISVLSVNHAFALRSRAFRSGRYEPRVLAALVLIQMMCPELDRQIRLDPILFTNLLLPATPHPGSDDQIDSELKQRYLPNNSALEAALTMVKPSPSLDLSPYLTWTSITNTVIKDDFERTPRNAPCPCGSKKKFKNCHGGA